ncbi:hypothetical protein ACJJTC_013220 [Scirpophaga incertulas]
MMYDPPDYPYKEFTDNLDVNYETDLYNSNNLTLSTELVNVTEEMISSVEKDLLYHSNDSGRFFNSEDTHRGTNDNSVAHDSFSLGQSENLFNCESTLLDDNLVNQFLLPIKNSEDGKDTSCIGPDVLALHSCVICHEIFTSDTDLLDHTILLHASVDQLPNDTQYTSIFLRSEENPEECDKKDENNNIDLDTNWFVCNLCERVLSTGLEVEPAERLCCSGVDGKGSVAPRKLSTMYVCDKCNGLFADAAALDRHRQRCSPLDTIDYCLTDMDQNKLHTVLPVTEVSEVYFSCETCESQFASADLLKLHMGACQGRLSGRPGRRCYANKTNNTKMWNCGSCNQLFATARELYRHKRGEDRPPGTPLTAFVCEECDKVLGSMCALHTHKKMHKVSKPGYPCRVCGRRFNQSGHLAIHMRMHTGERPYPCDLCSKAFKVKVERDDHRRTHTGERPFACAACPKTFTAAARLREHSRIHTDQRPYQCDICGAAFRRPYARTVHTLIHTGEKPHECDVCGTAFRRSGDMWKHKRTLHGVVTI